MSSDTHEITGAQRLAGVLLVCNGLALATERFLAPETGEGTLGGSPVALLLDIGLGLSLCLGMATAGVLAFVRFRVVAGALLLSAVHLFSGDPVMMVAQLVMSGGLCLLLFGDAGVARAFVGTGLVAAILALEVVGLGAIATGQDVANAESASSEPASGEASTGDWTAKIHDLVSASDEPAAPEADPEELAAVRCEINGSLTFMSRGDCLARRGRPY